MAKQKLSDEQLELSDPDHTWRVHHYAMIAKEATFLAQDSLHDVPDPELQTKLSDALAEVRLTLEAIDRLVPYDDTSRACLPASRRFLNDRFKARMGW